MTKLVCLRNIADTSTSLRVEISDATNRVIGASPGRSASAPSRGEIVTLAEADTIYSPDGNPLRIIRLVEYGDSWFCAADFGPIDYEKRDLELFREIAGGARLPDSEPGERIPARKEPVKTGARLACLANDFDAIADHLKGVGSHGV